jgi:hypothetical protein
MFYLIAPELNIFRNMKQKIEMVYSLKDFKMFKTSKASQKTKEQKILTN